MNDISAADTTGPAALYRARSAAGAIRPDPAQGRVADRLDQLYREMRQPEGRRGWLARLGLGDNGGEERPRGIYLWGPVGRGKSMLMDLFFAAAPTERKRRVHFHSFMLEVHD